MTQSILKNKPAFLQAKKQDFLHWLSQSPDRKPLEQVTEDKTESR